MNRIAVMLVSGLIYFIILSLLYLYDQFAGYLMNIILGGMTFSVLTISYIADRIQKSKVPNSYFWSLWGCIIGSALCFIFLRYSF